MTPSHWRNVKEITADALELPAGERAVFLAGICGEDTRLREEVEKLIALDESQGLLDQAVHGGLGAPSLPERALLGGRFRILHLIARGGMGEVYRAEDLEFGEEVALKVISREIAGRAGIVDRFRREVQRARRVTHPNVCRIHDLYSHTDGNDTVLLFFTMQLVEGPTLAELLRTRPLPTRDGMALLVELMAGLEAAHDAGLAHCDLKPSNVMVVENESGGRRAIVTDFGLARALQSENDTGAAQSLFVGGAPAYMAPEALFGGVGIRSDIYAFGLIAYETLTGRHPLGRKPAWEVAQDFRVTPPRQINPEIPMEWEGAILRCIERDPVARFDSLREMRAALEPKDRKPPSGITRRRVAYAAAGALVSAGAVGEYFHWKQKSHRIAVLPFENGTRDESLEYLSDGITEILINNLSQVPRLRVPAAGLVRRFKGTQGPTKAGESLNASAVLTGRVQKRDGLLSVQAELIDVSSGRQLWGKQYNLEWTNLLDLQQSICTGILAGLQLPLGEQETKILRRGLTANDEAFQLYLRGQYLLGQRTAANLKKAFDLFTQAAELDRGFARAFSGIATARLLLGYYGVERPVDSMPGARRAAQQAIDIEPQLAEGHNALAAIKALFDWDWEGAEQSFRRAIALKDDFAEAHHWLARCVLSPLARPTEAIAEIHRALDSDPSALIIHTNLGLIYYHARRYDDAIQQLQKVVEINPAYSFAYWTLGFSWAGKGNLEKAVAAHQTARRLEPGARPDICLAYSYAACGKQAEARGMLEQILRQYRRPAYAGVEIAFLQATLGDTEAAFHSLDLSAQDREPQLIDAGIDPKMDPLRKLPAYSDFLRRIRFNPQIYRSARLSNPYQTQIPEEIT